jgi:hypothetical protein
LISYEVVSRDSFSIQECNVGSGAPCGAVYLSKGFETLLHRKLGDKAAKILNAKRLGEAMRYFETAIKYDFNPCNEACETVFEVPLPGAPDTPSIKLEDSYLQLTRLVLLSIILMSCRDEIDDVFRRVFDRILDLINNQIAEVRAKGKKLKVFPQGKCLNSCS